MKRVLLIILLHLSLFFIVFAYQAQADEKNWEISKYEGQSYALVSGEIQRTDKFSFVLSPEDQCQEVSSMFSFFTWNLFILFRLNTMYFWIALVNILIFNFVSFWFPSLIFYYIYGEELYFYRTQFSFLIESFNAKYTL